MGEARRRPPPIIPWWYWVIRWEPPEVVHAWDRHRAAMTIAMIAGL